MYQFPRYVPETQNIKMLIWLEGAIKMLGWSIKTKRKGLRTIKTLFVLNVTGKAVFFKQCNEEKSKAKYFLSTPTSPLSFTLHSSILILLWILYFFPLDALHETMLDC